MANELEKLQEGNRKFMANQPTQKDFSSMRNATKDGQQPYAIVVTCSDSRVPPEYIFDGGIGEIFVVRTAGNVIDKVALGSIEYAVEHLHTPLLIVMGHEKCGAVKAAWDAANDTSGENHHNNIAHLIKLISPSVKKMKKMGKSIEDAVSENVKAQIRRIIRKSPICKKFVEEGKLRIVGAKYMLASGAVEIIS